MGRGGPRTDPDVARTASGWVRVLGKTAWWSRGLAGLRLLPARRPCRSGSHPHARERRRRRGLDTAMGLGYGHPMGLLRSTDMMGLDVRLAIAEYLPWALGPRF